MDVLAFSLRVLFVPIGSGPIRSDSTRLDSTRLARDMQLPAFDMAPVRQHTHTQNESINQSMDARLAEPLSVSALSLLVFCFAISSTPSSSSSMDRLSLSSLERTLFFGGGEGDREEREDMTKPMHG